MARIRAHFVGGPAHGDDRLIESNSGTWQVSVLPQLSLDDRVRAKQPAGRYVADVHVYYIREIGPNTFIAVHSDIAG